MNWSTAAVINETLPRPAMPVEAPTPPRWTEHAHQNESTPNQVYSRLLREHEAAGARIARLEQSKVELGERRAVLMNSDGDSTKIAKELSTLASELELQEHRLRTAISERDGFWKALETPSRAVLILMSEDLRKISDAEQTKHAATVVELVTSWGVEASKIEGHANELAGHHPVVFRTWLLSEDAKAAHGGALSSVMTHIDLCAALLKEYAHLQPV